MEEVIHARGHFNVRSRHETTFEVTRETHLTPRGDCIIAVAADKGMDDLSEEFKKKLRDDNATLEITVECNGIQEKVIAHGSRQLILKHPTDMVVRKSEFIDGRTLAIKASKSAKEFNRKLVGELKKDVVVKVTLRLK
ncbi:MAG: DUF371 domain-containing protein [Candidatus Altiarchaeales archaeon]|nr:DUF371 domain-containing protein [Candidatus Altiarchaeales archaeon]